MLLDGQIERREQIVELVGNARLGVTKGVR